MKVGTITEDILEQILEQNNLKDVAAEYGVHFDGNNKAKCPFHKEGATGNLHYYEDNNTYYCFCRTCQAGTRWKDKKNRIPHVLKFSDGFEMEDGGPNVIGFVMNIERCSYVEACVKLMERAGIQIPAAHVNKKLERQKQACFDMNKRFYKALLKDKKMMEYLRERGISEESMLKFRLGVVPKDFEHPVFKTLIAGRLVFGITEPHYTPTKAKTIAMAYRNMTEPRPSGEAKYINDKTSEIYKKGELLYGYNEARRAIRENGYAIVMEGYTDVIISHQSTIENAVATCGTSFTTEQMLLLRKLTKNLYLWYDGDTAGIEAMQASIEEALSHGFRVFVINSAPYDPAELMNKFEQNGKRIKKYIEQNAKPAPEFVASLALDEFDRKVGAARRAALDELMPLMNAIIDPTDKVLFRTMLEDRLGVVL